LKLVEFRKALPVYAFGLTGFRWRLSESKQSYQPGSFDADLQWPPSRTVRGQWVNSVI
jgi:hypothetical protein